MFLLVLMVITATSAQDGDGASIVLNCRNNTGFVGRGIKFLRLVTEEKCVNRRCYIRADNDRVTELLLYRHYEAGYETFDTTVWSRDTLTIEIRGEDVVLVPDTQPYHRDLPRILESRTGTFNIQCTGQPSLTPTTSRSSESPPTESTKLPSSTSTLSKTHIIIIIVVAVTLCIIAVFIAIFIFIYRKQKAAMQKGTYKEPAKDNIYKNAVHSAADLETAMPLNSQESTPVYNDPEKKCAIQSPHHYDNKPKVTTPPHNQLSNDNYSYTYSEPKYKPKVLPKPGKAKPKQALTPPKTPFKPTQLKQQLNAKYQRQSSEAKYEDIESSENVFKNH